MSSVPSSSVSLATLAAPVTHKRQLVAWLESGAKPKPRWRVGTEWEVFLFDRETLAPLPYDGERGIAGILHELQAFRWKPLEEKGKLIALQRGEASISLEPAGQFELSGAPMANLHQTAEELGYHIDQLGSVGRVLGFGALGIGFQPKWKRGEMPWMPKDRYAIMREYMPQVGTLGLDMMTRTATVQANLDFSDEADMVRKMRVAVALQPVVGALFANSPFRDGNLSGEQSFRNRVWQHTDAQRTAYPEFVFEESFGFERYVDWALSVPMYFIKRKDAYINALGHQFGELMDGKLDTAPGEVATLADWDLHLTTLFPCVRLKRYIEMRGADMGAYDMALALPALWVGLLYDETALDEATQLIGGWTAEDRQHLYKEAPRLGFQTEIAGHSLLNIARKMVAIAERGLERRNIAGAFFASETSYLTPLHIILSFGLTQAEELKRLYLDDWNTEIDNIFDVCALT